MFSVYERIEKLIEETGDLRKELNDLKETLRQQNELIITILSEQTGVLEETNVAEATLPQDKELSEFSRRFPLKDLEDLKNFESEINDDNKAYIVSIMRNLLLPNGILRNLSNVLSYDIIMKSNMDGHHYKKRLLNFPKTIDLLFLGCLKDDNYTLKIFLNDLKRSLRVGKNRCHKHNCRERKKSLLREEQEREEPVQIIKRSIVVKTEETYFPPCL